MNVVPVGPSPTTATAGPAVAGHPDMASSERDRHTRAVLDLVVQRLFAVAARLSGTAIERDGDAALTSSIELIDDTIELVRTEVLERYDRRHDVSGAQAELLDRRKSAVAVPPTAP